MKTLFTLATISAVALALPLSSFAAQKKEAAAAAAAEAKKPATAAPDAVKAAKPLPMHSRADAIDAAGKSFTTTRKKDGAAIKHVVTATTEIKNGEAAAKFGDIKVGDFVNGLRNKKSDTEYEVVKITSFGPTPMKKVEGAPKKEMKKEPKKAE